MIQQFIVLQTDLPKVNLFSNSQSTAGLVILVIFVGGLLIWVACGLLGHLRAKRREERPVALGDPCFLLEQVGGMLGLGISDRHFLTKVAHHMGVVQPVSILLSPALMVRAVSVWESKCLFTPTKRWGRNRLDGLARTIYGKSLRELETAGR